MKNSGKMKWLPLISSSRKSWTVYRLINMNGSHITPVHYQSFVRNDGQGADCMPFCSNAKDSVRFLEALTDQSLPAVVLHLSNIINSNQKSNTTVWWNKTMFLNESLVHWSKISNFFEALLSSTGHEAIIINKWRQDMG